jgi:hypothetical protein
MTHKAIRRVRVNNPGDRKPASRQPEHAALGEAMCLTPQAKRAAPKLDNLFPKGHEHRAVEGHPIVVIVSCQHRPQPGPKPWNGPVHPLAQGLLDLLQLPPEPFRLRLSPDRELPLSRPPTYVGKTEKVEDLRLSFPLKGSPHGPCAIHQGQTQGLPILAQRASVHAWGL